MGILSRVWHVPGMGILSCVWHVRDMGILSRARPCARHACAQLALGAAEVTAVELRQSLRDAEEPLKRERADAFYRKVLDSPLFTPLADDWEADEGDAEEGQPTIAGYVDALPMLTRERSGGGAGGRAVAQPNSLRRAPPVLHILSPSGTP